MPDRTWDQGSCLSQINIKWMFKVLHTLTPTYNLSSIFLCFCRLVSLIEAAKTPRPCVSILLSHLPLSIFSFSSDSPLAFIYSDMPCDPHYHRAFAHAFSAFHLVYTQSSFMSQVCGHFLWEALPDFSRLGQFPPLASPSTMHLLFLTLICARIY